MRAAYRRPTWCGSCWPALWFKADGQSPCLQRLKPRSQPSNAPASPSLSLSLSLSLCMSCADAVATLSAARGAGLAPGAFVAGLVASSAELSGLSRNRIVKVAQQPKLEADLAKRDVAASDLALRRPCCAVRRQTAQGMVAIHELAEDWRFGGSLISGMSQRREALNIMLSLLRGTDAQLLLRAAREFAQAGLPDHKYVMVLHNHQENPHVHLSVLAESKQRRRLNPRKADLQRWRETFAEKLRGCGIDAEASRQASRGLARNYECLGRSLFLPLFWISRGPLKAAPHCLEINRSLGLAK